MSQEIDTWDEMEKREQGVYGGIIKYKKVVIKYTLKEFFIDDFPEICRKGARTDIDEEEAAS